MVGFLAGRDRLRSRRLHVHIKNRLQTDDRFRTVRLRVATPEEPGPYRVVADTRRGQFVDPTWSDRTARLEIGFRLPTESTHEHYWINWIEPDREVLVAWHQDRGHADLGPDHLQVEGPDVNVRHESAVFLDEHPMAVVEARLDQLSSTLEAHTAD